MGEVQRLRRVLICADNVTAVMAYDHCRAQKGGFFKDAASEGIAILFPDTSPRGAGVEGEDDDWVRI